MKSLNTADIALSVYVNRNYFFFLHSKKIELPGMIFFFLCRFSLNIYGFPPTVHVYDHVNWSF